VEEEHTSVSGGAEVNDEQQCRQILEKPPGIIDEEEVCYIYLE